MPRPKKHSTQYITPFNSYGAQLSLIALREFLATEKDKLRFNIQLTVDTLEPGRVYDTVGGAKLVKDQTGTVFLIEEPAPTKPVVIQDWHNEPHPE